MNLVEKLIEMDKTSPRRILVIGDNMTDMYVHGILQDCQDGCKKFVQEHEFIVPGGAGNAKRSLENWNTEVRSAYDLDCRQQAPMKVRFLVDDKIVYRWDNDQNKIDFELYREQAKMMLRSWKPDGVLLTDYDKGLLTPEFLREIITFCKVENIPCVADAKRPPEIYEGAVLKCNQEYAKRFLRSWAGKYILVTRGAEGPYHLGITIPSGPSVRCINHVGAGDCFAAHLTLSLVYGFSLKESAEVAHSAGRVYVQYRHNKPPIPAQIVDDMNSKTNPETYYCS